MKGKALTSEAKLPPLCKQFRLPSLGKRIDAIDVPALHDRARKKFREGRSIYLQAHAHIHGASRDHACTYTQKTHDQIQGQINGTYSDMLTIQAVLYSFLEIAFERLDQLENETHRLSYQGVWEQRDYAQGAVVTFGGSCWHTNKKTNARPGADPEAWTLMVRRGRDGKDATT